ncbi:MAG TPA: DUF3501 family protein [Acidimicrobiales bacterium]|nr:DUF3501 family protein [Acidimicrobiales bacterium]
MSRKLTLDDIADMRAYERERAEFRRHVIDLKRRRRVSVGPHITFVFENRDTIRFQIQEMARVERLYSDAQIEHELHVYNPLIPEPGELSATMFLELTSEAQLREWLPKLVGIERSVVLRVGEGERLVTIPLDVDVDHAEQLTREDVTSAVHYLHATLTSADIDRIAAGPVVLGIDHPAYRHETALDAETVSELLTDLGS